MKKERRMNMGDLIFLIFFIFIIGSLGVLLPLVVIYGTTGDHYVTDKVVDCNDEDGDVIEGLICHEEIYCSEKLEFMNEKGCEVFVEGEE